MFHVAQYFYDFPLEFMCPALIDYGINLSAVMIDSA